MAKLRALHFFGKKVNPAHRRGFFKIAFLTNKANLFPMEKTFQIGKWRI